ncbi:UNKNOWN [Stylonychia lemnae]|uniref:Uncharacterized protein n=1 Tax=Stylonychia lemnae TaxID=5949 RepID=A0A078A744_STYLE|nr:UNKNOWN [Stylonychia lemnae]|eukprot:CDW77701.1 UNKNOWN [Stylonychia lemnae]
MKKEVMFKDLQLKYKKMQINQAQKTQTRIRQGMFKTSSNPVLQTDKAMVEQPYFENMPLMIFGQEDKGWHGIFKGIISPFKNKYQVYIENVLKRKNENQYDSQMPEEIRRRENMRKLETFISTERDYYYNKRHKKYFTLNRFDQDNKNSATDLNTCKQQSEVQSPINLRKSDSRTEILLAHNDQSQDSESVEEFDKQQDNSNTPQCGGKSPVRFQANQEQVKKFQDLKLMCFTQILREESKSLQWMKKIRRNSCQGSQCCGALNSKINKMDLKCQQIEYDISLFNSLKKHPHIGISSYQSSPIDRYMHNKNSKNLQTRAHSFMHDLRMPRTYMNQKDLIKTQSTYDSRQNQSTFLDIIRMKQIDPSPNTSPRSSLLIQKNNSPRKIPTQVKLNIDMNLVKNRSSILSNNQPFPRKQLTIIPMKKQKQSIIINQLPDIKENFNEGGETNKNSKKESTKQFETSFRVQKQITERKCTQEFKNIQEVITYNKNLLRIKTKKIMNNLERTSQSNKRTSSFNKQSHSEYANSQRIKEEDNHQYQMSLDEQSKDSITSFEDQNGTTENLEDLPSSTKQNSNFRIRFNSGLEDINIEDQSPIISCRNQKIQPLSHQAPNSGIPRSIQLNKAESPLISKRKLEEKQKIQDFIQSPPTQYKITEKMVPILKQKYKDNYESTQRVLKSAENTQTDNRYNSVSPRVSTEQNKPNNQELFFEKRKQKVKIYSQMPQELIQGYITERKTYSQQRKTRNIYKQYNENMLIKTMIPYQQKIKETNTLLNLTKTLLMHQQFPKTTRNIHSKGYQSQDIFFPQYTLQS